MFPFLGTKLF